MTISLPGVLLGSQTPRVLSRPAFVSSAGADAIELAELVAGVYLDPWQKLVVEVILAERADGRWSAFEAAMLVSRQNGKGEILLVLELAGLFLFGERLIIHSAHEFKTAQEAFLRLKLVLEGAPSLSRRVLRVRTSHGDEGIELKSGQRIRFLARSKSSGRGFTSDRLILDECQQLPRSAMSAILPTLSARDNPQVVYAGTVPEDLNDSEHFESLRDRGRAGGDPSLSWVEWSPTGSDEFDLESAEGLAMLDDHGAWAEGVPALGGRIELETVARLRLSLGAEGFAREVLSIWPNGSGSRHGDVDAARWAMLEGLEAARPAPVAFGLEVSDDRRWSSIALAGWRSDGGRHVQMVETRRGTDWVVERLGELVGTWSPVAVAVNPSGPAGSLIPDLEAAKVRRLVKLTGRQLGQGCGLFLDGVTAGTIHHAGQPVLTAAVEAGKLKNAGDARVWHGRTGDVDVSPLQAVTWALVGLASSPRKVKRAKSRVVVHG